MEKGIIERQDLSIYEKMCCVVLAKWATEEIEEFNMVTLAEEMSCTLSKAKETIRQLKSKGFIQSIDQEDFVEQIPRIIKAEDVEGLEPVNFASPAAPKSKEVLMDEVRTIVTEPLNDSETKIILNFAGDDIEKIKLCYKKAKNMQVGDKVEALMMELQRKEKPPAKLPPMTEEILDEEVILEGLLLEKNSVNEEAEDLVDANEIIQEISEEIPDEVIFNEESDSKEEDNQDLKSESDKKEERPWYLEDDDEEVNDIIKPPSGNQINTNMIHKMKAYKKYGK